MTLRPALARLERGFKRLWGRAVALATGARPYRYDGEQEAHADQLRETRVSLAMMASADAGNPDQVRMASDIEDGAEQRLVVLLGKPRLSRAEKHERDAIQAAISARRQGFAAPTAPRRFFAAPAALALGGVRPWMIWTGAVVLLLGALGIQTGRIDSLKADLREARADIAQAERNLAGARTERDLLSDRMQAADQQARTTAENLEAERTRRLRTDRELRRAQNAINAASTDAPNDYGFNSVRSDGTTEPGAPGASGGTPAGNSR